MTDAKKKALAAQTRKNVLESLKDIGSIPQDFFKDMAGFSSPTPKREGELNPGESMMMSEVISGKDEENKRLRSQIVLERNLSGEQNRLSEQKLGELRVNLQALITEVVKLQNATQNLAQETQVAIMQAPVEPGIYHINFFQKVLAFLVSFRKKIEEASVWLGASNSRAEKKNYWARYKKGKGSFLLSPDHYLQRSAG